MKTHIITNDQPAERWPGLSWMRFRLIPVCNLVSSCTLKHILRVCSALGVGGWGTAVSPVMPERSPQECFSASCNPDEEQMMVIGRFSCLHFLHIVQNPRALSSPAGLQSDPPMEQKCSFSLKHQCEPSAGATVGLGPAGHPHTSIAQLFFDQCSHCLF